MRLAQSSASIVFVVRAGAMMQHQLFTQMLHVRNTALIAIKCFIEILVLKINIFL